MANRTPGVIAAALPAWTRVPRPVRWAVLGLLLAYALYLVAGNLFINTPLGPWAANRKPEKFHIEWNSGYTLWPGRVHASGIRLRGRTAHIAWSVDADAARARLRLLPLFQRRVQVAELLASGVRGEVDPITDGPAPPVPREGGWTLQFDRIASDSVTGGRYGDLRLEGDGRAEVAFSKVLRGGPMELLPSTAHFEHARLFRGDDEWLSDASVDAGFSMARHTRAQAPGIAKLPLIDARLKAKGGAPGLRVIARQADSGVDVATVPRRGSIDVDLAMAKGALQPGGSARLRMPVEGTDFDGATGHNALEATITVDRDIHVAAKAPPVSTSAIALDADLVLEGNALPVDGLAPLVARSSGHVVGRWRFASLQWIDMFMPPAPWLSLDGEGLVDADLGVRDGRPVAGSRVDVPEVAAVAVVMGNRIEGKAHIGARLDAGQGGALLPRLELAMERFSIAPAKEPGLRFVEGTGLRLEVETVADGDATMALDGSALRQAGEHAKARLRFSEARVPDLRAYNRYLPGDSIRFEGGSGHLGGDLAVDGAGEIAKGWLKVRGDGARLDFAGIKLSGDVDVHAQLARGSLEDRTLDLDGSRIALTGVRFSEPGGETRSGWWTRVGFGRARIDLAAPTTVDGRVDIAMRDIGFLLSMFSRQRDYPDWVFKLVDAGQAKATARVRWRGDTLVLDRVAANNDRYDVKARIRLQGKQRNGSLYARWGLLGCAVDTRGGQRDFHVVRARQWYESQPDLLR